MGASNWDNATRATYCVKKTARVEMPQDQVFQKRTMREDFNPVNITLRESVDSEQNPESTAIIIGLDVTGSMGFVAEHIAKQGLGTLVEGLLDLRPVSDPHFMMMAVGDISYDKAPLQVTQFEADIRIDEQLTDLWLEHGGGGNQYESYDLPWIFAANKTHIDCFEKRGKKGYLFTIGDEKPPVSANRSMIGDCLGISLQCDPTTPDSLMEAQKKYEVFHVCAEEGSRRGEYAAWEGLLGRRAIRLNNHKHIPEVITSVIQVSEGMLPADAISQWQDNSKQESVKYSLKA